MDPEPMDAAPEPHPNERLAPLLDSRRRRRRRVAAAVAVVGAMALGAGLIWRPGFGASEPTSVEKAEKAEKAENAPVDAATENVGKPPSTAPGGVGLAPEKTGLPAIPAEGGKVRTGTKDQGCFASMREYLDAWHRTEKEPDPCFIAQQPSEQKQPEGVARTYNGERF